MVRKDASDIFSYSEFAIAGDMTKRAFQHLTDANAKSPRSELLPVGGGIRALKRVAVLGGFMSAGVPLLAAARIASALLQYEFNTYDGEVPSGLGFLARSLPKGAMASIPGRDVDTDYWYHRELIKHPDIYVPGAALDSDALVEIVDRTHIYMGSMSGLGVLNPWDGQSDKASYAGRIEGWARDSDAYFVSAAEMAPLDRDDPEFKTKGAALNAMSRAAYRNAVGRITVNLSLAIRNGLDRIARHRGSLREAGE